LAHFTDKKYSRKAGRSRIESIDENFTPKRILTSPRCVKEKGGTAKSHSDDRIYLMSLLGERIQKEFVNKISECCYKIAEKILVSVAMTDFDQRKMGYAII